MMKSPIVLFAMFAAPVGALLTMHFAKMPAELAGMTCVDEKQTSYGYVQKQAALAEMAGIITWQKDAEQASPGFGDWHLAQKRAMNCRRFSRSDSYQCVLSARPCRMDRS